MYTQFFGNYLLSNNYVTKEQLFSAMQRQENEHMKLGTLAIHAGYMDAGQVDEVVLEQKHQDRKFGELALEKNYLTEEQLEELLHMQPPSFLMLGQVLLNDEIITNTDLENSLIGYQAENGIDEEDGMIEQQEVINRLFDNFFEKSGTEVSSNGFIYAELLFNDLIRFIGDDFTPLSVHEVTESPVEYCVKQSVLGDYDINTYISMDHTTAMEFASRYVNERFKTFNEYVQASLEDFLNLQNGLFTVNVSNDSATELTLSAPEVVDTTHITFAGNTLYFPILFSFGRVEFFLEPGKTSV
jgi:CheY-specific phosphatase CheX